MTTLASLTVKLIGDISDFEEKMSTASSRMQQAGQRMMGTGAVLSAGVTLPLVSIGAAAVNAAASFESSLSMMQAVSGATADQMAQVSDVAMALGADLTLPGTSASDAAEAMTELSRAGLTVQESMDAARGVLELSAAAEISNADAATIVANALNSFGLAGTEAGRVANLLAGGANASSASITDMAAGLQMSSAVAASMGVPIEDLTTSIAAMANAGIAGSDAGTSLKTMLMRLSAPTDQARGLMQQLGISVFDAQGQMLPMRSIIEQFSTTMAGMTMEQRNAALATIFGTDAIRAANIVLLEGTASFDSMKEAVTREGAAHDLAAAKMGGFSGALEGLRSTIETVLLTVGTPFLEMLTGIVKRGAEVIGRIAELDPRIITLGVGFAALLAAIGPVVTILGGVVTALGLVLSPIGLVVAAIVGLAMLVVQHFGGIEQTITAVTTTVQNIMTALSTFFQANGTQITGWVTAAWTQVQAIINGVVNAVSAIVRAIFGAVATFMQSHGEEIKAFMLDAWTRIGEIVNLALQLIQATVIPALQAIAQFINEHGAEIQAIMNVVWTAIKTIIDVALTLIKGILQAALAIIRGDWSGALEILRSTAEQIWNRISSIIETVATAIATFLATKWAEIKADVAAKMADIKADMEAKWNDIKAGIADRIQQIKDNLFNRLTDMVNSVRDKVAEIKQWFVDKLNEVKSFIEGFDLAEVGRNLVQGLIDGVVSMAGSLIDAAVGVVSDAIAAAKALLGISSPSTVFRAIGIDTMAGLGLGFESGSSGAADALRDAIRVLIDLADELPDDLADKFAGFADIGEAIMILARGPAGDIRSVIDSWRTQIQYVIRMMSQIWQNWEDKNVFVNAGQVGEVIKKIFEPWEKIGEAIAIITAGPGNWIPQLENWKTQIVMLIRMMAMVWRNWDDKVIFDQAASAAETLGAVVKPWKELGEALALIVAGPGEYIGEAIKLWELQVAALISGLVRMAQQLGQSAQAANMAAMLTEIAEAIRDALSKLTDLGGITLDDISEAAQVAGLRWTEGLIRGIRSRLPDLGELLDAVVNRLSMLDTYTPGLYLGQTWVQGIIDGIRAALPELEATIKDVLNVTPEPGGGGPDAGGMVFNMNGPFYIREDGDIQRLAEEISRLLGGQAQQNRRMNVGWSA